LSTGGEQRVERLFAIKKRRLQQSPPEARIACRDIFKDLGIGFPPFCAIRKPNDF
jgi:hypothetical protein